MELMPMAGCWELYRLPPERITGVHLPFYTSWLDLWRGDENALLREYGTWENVRAVFVEVFFNRAHDYFAACFVVGADIIVGAFALGNRYLDFPNCFRRRFAFADVILMPHSLAIAGM